MSPVSRGRKKRNRSSRPGRRPGAATLAPEAVDIRGIFAEMLRPFREVATEDDPLDAEVCISGLLGAWWNTLPPGEDPDTAFGLAVVDYARDRGTPDALAFLRAVSVTGVADSLRVAARAAADELAGSGVVEASWAARLGQVAPGECWQMADVYGDQASLLCSYSYGDESHGVLALLDFNHLDGWVKDVMVTDDPQYLLEELRREAARSGLAVLERVEPAEARRLLEDGFAATDATWQPDVPDTFRQFRAVALARCRALPEPARPAESQPVELPDGERDAIVEEFLAAAPPADAEADAEAARYCARLIVDFGCDYDSGRPLRVSPAKTEKFLLDWVPAKVILDDADRDAMPAVVSAWVRWAGERAGLPPAALVELAEVADNCGAHFAKAYDDPANSGPAKHLLRGLDLASIGSVEDLQDAVDRRQFVMPYLGTRIGGEDFPDLDPSDADERGLLIQGEHPEYHAALDDPAFDGEIDGVNPHLHIAMHEIVANQLWDDDPPEAWAAAKRLRAAGLDRHDILHLLGGVIMRHLHGALTAGQPADVEAYRQDLAALKADSPQEADPPQARTAVRRRRKPDAGRGSS